jgi:hypothetical protein
MRGTQVVLVSLLAAAWPACGGTPRSPLERLLADLEERVEDRDADEVAELLAADFAADGHTRASVPAELRRYFFAYEGLDATFSEVVPEGSPPQRVSLRVDLSGQPREVGGLAGLLPAVSAYRFELGLEDEGGALRIRSARWERLDLQP